MSFFALKISDASAVDLVNEIKASSTDLVVSQLNQLETDLKIGSYVFIQLAGWVVPWEKGLIGLAEIINEPFDKGYDTDNARNFRLRLKMVIVLDNVISREEFIPYVNSYDAAGIGPTTKGEQNQAIKSVTDAQAYTILRAMVDKQHDIEGKIRELFDAEACNAIFGKIQCLRRHYVTYDEAKDEERKHEELSEFEEQNKNDFIAWLKDYIQTKGPNAGQPHSQLTQDTYIAFLSNYIIDVAGAEHSIFACVDIGEINKLYKEEYATESNSTGNNRKSSAIKKYEEYVENKFGATEGREADSEDETSKKNCLSITRKPREDKTYQLNSIIYGAPGTGKTYGTAEYALRITGTPVPDDRKELMKAYNGLISEGQVVFTTFHQSYGYEEFIQGLRPNTKSEKVAFKTEDGVFKAIADKAISDFEKNYVIIIDEINRANISKVFGELITLVEEDKRWGEINETCATLQSGDIFAVPNNLYIVGTMNSADKSISLIDAALRRRFTFIEQRPDAELINDDDLKKIFIKLNEHLAEKLKSSDLLIGHSYFMDKSMSDLPELMNNKVIPLLYEYFYDQKDKVKNAIAHALSEYENQMHIVDDKIGRIRVEIV